MASRHWETGRGASLHGVMGRGKSAETPHPQRQAQHLETPTVRTHCRVLQTGRSEGGTERVQQRATAGKRGPRQEEASDEWVLEWKMQRGGEALASWWETVQAVPGSPLPVPSPSRSAASPGTRHPQPSTRHPPPGTRGPPAARAKLSARCTRRATAPLPPGTGCRPRVSSPLADPKKPTPPYSAPPPCRAGVPDLHR